MRKFLVAAMLTLAAPAAVAQAPSDGWLTITGVAIVDPAAGSNSAPMDIVVADGRIERIVPAGTAPPRPGERRLDAAGRFALPGLIDVHAHVGEGGAGSSDERARARALSQFLRYGVTTIFVPGGTGGGDDDLAPMRARCAARPGTCPGIFGSGALVTVPGSHPVTTIFGLPADAPAEALAARGLAVLAPGEDPDAVVAARAAAGADAIKIVIEDGPPPWYPRPRMSEAEAAGLVRAAHSRGLPVFAHVGDADDVRIALAAGVDAIMHSALDRLPDAMLRRMADAQLWYVPTFALYDGILTWANGRRETDPFALAGVDPGVIEGLAAPDFLAEAPGTPERARSSLDQAADNLVRAAAAGVPVALGTDVNNPFVFPGFSAHEELSLMVRAGLTPAEALRAAARGAEFLHAEREIGRIAPGYQADLLILEADPLVDIANTRRIFYVVADGRLVSDPVSIDRPGR